MHGQAEVTRGMTDAVSDPDAKIRELYGMDYGEVMALIAVAQPHVHAHLMSYPGSNDKAPFVRKSVLYSMAVDENGKGKQWTGMLKKLHDNPKLLETVLKLDNADHDDKGKKAPTKK